jgi:hypothetical protein
VHVVWFDGRDGNLEIYHKRSPDHGNTWGPDTRLTYAVGDSQHASIAISGNPAHVVWFDDREGTPQVFYRSLRTGDER